MTVTDIVVIAIIVLIVAGASFYIYRAKKNGQKCIGCPSSKTCSGSCSGCDCGCSSKDAPDKK